MSLENVKLHLVNDFDGAQALMSWLGTTDTTDGISVDTETTGLVIGHDRVKLVQVGGYEHGWAIPYDRWNGLFADVMRRYDGPIDMHNAKFDAGMLDNQGRISVHIPRERIRDTRVMSHVNEPHQSTALKNQASRHVDPDAAAAQDILKGTDFTWATVPEEYGPYWQYAALDPVLTSHLRRHHLPLIQLTGVTAAFDLENAYTWVAEKMERRGLYVDVDFTQELYDRFTRKVEEIGAWCKSEWKVSPGSNQEVIRVLESEGVTFDKRTKGGALSLDSEVLESIDHTLAKAVLQRRRLQKLASTYLRHYIEEHDADWLIHPSFNTLGARTSRMSMERPNMQNLPRKSEKNPPATEVRRCIRTRYWEQLGTLLMCDFDQIEMRMLAELSGDEGLIAAFLGPEDFFISLAREIFQDPTLVKKDPRRQLTKNTAYAEVYGAGTAKMALTAGVSFEQAAATKQRFNTLYPRVPAFKKAVEQVAWRRQREEGFGYAKTALTKRRMVADMNKIYALVNYLIQGSAAEIFKERQLQLDAAGLGDYMILPVHDEIILDVPPQAKDDAVATLRDIMNDRYTFRVPITASVSAGERWGDKEDLW